MLAAFATTIFFSVSAVCAHRTTRQLGGVTANFYRILLATALLGLWGHTFGTGFSGKAWPYFFVSGLVGFGLGDLALYQALPRLGSRLSVLLIQCLPVPLAAATEWLWLGTRLTVTEMVSGGVILAGVAWALTPGEHLNLTRRDLQEGIFFGVLAALGQGGGALLSRKAAAVALAAGQQPPDGLTAAYQRIWGGLLVAALVWGLVWWHRKRSRLIGKVKSPSIVSEDSLPIDLSASEFASPPALREETETDSRVSQPRIWPWVLANALAGPALGVGCYQRALMQQGTGVVLPIVALTPIVIIPFALWIEGERPTGRSLLGGIIAVAGAVAMATAAR